MSCVGLDNEFPFEHYLKNYTHSVYEFRYFYAHLYLIFGFFSATCSCVTLMPGIFGCEYLGMEIK